jgi:hypothetical protein
VDKQRQKYKGLLDMIDGGGAGAVGNEFEGGGLLSVIANAIATPYGSSDRMRDAMQEQRPMARPSGGFGNGSAGSVAPELVYSGRGNVGMPMPESQMPLTKASDIPGGFNFANAAPVQPDPFSYNGDREAGMAGLVPTPGRYDFGLPDDSNDFGINPNVGPNPFAGSPGVGGDGRLLDGEILRYAPTGRPEAPSQDAAPSELQMRDFVQQIKEKYPNQVNEILRSPSLSNIINHYIRNGVLPVVGPTP